MIVTPASSRRSIRILGGLKSASRAAQSESFTPWSIATAVAASAFWMFHSPSRSSRNWTPRTRNDIPATSDGWRSARPVIPNVTTFSAGRWTRDVIRGSSCSTA